MLRAVTLALFTSLVYVLCFPRFDHAALAWISLIPLLLAVYHQGERRAFRLGWLAGTAATMGLMVWVLPVFQAAHTSMGLAILCWFALSAYLGLFWGIWTTCLVLMEEHVDTLWFPFWGAATWVALEFLKGWLFSGFPWALTGYSQWQSIALIQVCRFTGVYGVSFIVVLTNIVFCTVLTRPARRRSMVIVLVLLTALLAYGRYQVTCTTALDASSPRFQVALLQGNIDQYLKWDTKYENDIKQVYERLAMEASLSHPDLIVWPETAIPGFINQNADLLAWLVNLIHRTHAAHLAGAPSLTGKQVYNVAIALSPAGRPLGMYAKRHLVPFGEVIPFAPILGRWIHVLNQLGGTSAGRDLHPLSVAGARIAINICYEAIFPEAVRGSVNEGADLIANITNDGWYLRTAAPYQHFIHNVFRAVENDRWLVRADNTGISAIIRPTGQIERASGIFQEAVVEGTIYFHRDRTFYTRFGDVFAYLCLLLGFAPVLSRRLRRSGSISL